MLDYPNKLNKIFDKLYKKSKKIIIVGGYVRDSILHINSKDIDIEVYGINSFEELESILKEFGEINSVGKSFGVCKLNYKALELDFSLPRVDSKIALGYSGFDVKIDPTLDFKTAASRRDFTINAIGYDVKNKKLLDPYNGEIDLKNKFLRVVDKKTFIEDPLRILRAMQFCARFDLEIDESLLQLSKTMVKNKMLDELPKERIYEEFKKLFLKANKPSIGLEFLKSISALEYFPPLEKLNSKSWNLLKINIDKLSSILVNNEKINMVFYFSLLCYSQNLIKCNKFIQHFTNDKKLIHKVNKIIKNLNATNTKFISDYTLYKLALELNVSELLTVSKIIFEDVSYIEKKAKKLNIFTKALKPHIQGRDLISLGLTPSKNFSNILNSVYELQMKDEFSSYGDALKWVEKFIH